MRLPHRRAVLPASKAAANGASPKSPAAKTIADAEQFVDAYYQIDDARVRRDILALLKAAGGDEGETA